MSSFKGNKPFLSAEECKALFERIVGLTKGGGNTTVAIVSRWNGATRWARNRVQVASESQDIRIKISRSVARGGGGFIETSRADLEGLREAVQEAETFARIVPSPLTINRAMDIAPDPVPQLPILRSTIWSDSTYSFASEGRDAIVQDVIAGADSAGMVSAGELMLSAMGSATFSTDQSSDGTSRYYPETQVECSMTVRHPEGKGSGWAGVNHYALEKIDPRSLAAIALDKCKKSISPSAVEPGRYTVILEPQAVADLFKSVPTRYMGRVGAEMPAGPFGKSRGLSKISERVLDRRLILRSDPMDSEGGFLPFDIYNGTPYRPVDWISNGILRELAYDRHYAIRDLNTDIPLPNPRSFKLTAAPSAKTTTVEDMIAKTTRGILITRFSAVEVPNSDDSSVMTVGYTRDGVWLIERGKITRPVKNFRFRESPMFALNSIEDIGEPVRVYSPGLAHIVPALRIRDFNLVGLADAI